jgi:glycosyltransferase involved in cell wall biosynthesis
MRVLFISHSAAPSGAEIFLFRLVKALREVEPVLLFAKPGPMVQRFRDQQVRVHVASGMNVDISRDNTSVVRFARSALGMVKSGWELGGNKEFDGVDVVIAQSIKSLVIGWPLARRLRKPLVWSVHDRISADYMGPVKARLVRVMGRTVANAVIANSQSTLETIALGRKPHIVIYPGLDLAEFSAPAGTDVMAKPDSVHPLCVLNVGRLAAWKGQHVFLEAFDRAFADSSAKAVVVGGALFGEQAYEARLRDQARALTSSPRIRLTGHVDDVRPYIEGADIIVHSSVIPEPFGSVIIEAMAMRKPIIATRPGGPEEIISDGQDGLLVPGNDAEAMAGALTRLASDAGLRERLGANAARRAEFFSIGRQARNLETWLVSWVPPSARHERGAQR